MSNARMTTHSRRGSSDNLNERQQQSTLSRQASQESLQYKTAPDIPRSNTKNVSMRLDDSRQQGKVLFDFEAENEGELTSTVQFIPFIFKYYF